jgi:hypothetical protein
MDRDTYNAIGLVIFWVLVIGLLVRALLNRGDDKDKVKNPSRSEETEWVVEDEDRRERRAARPARAERRRETVVDVPEQRAAAPTSAPTQATARRPSIADDYDPFIPTVEEPEVAGANRALPVVLASQPSVDEDGVLTNFTPAAGTAGGTGAGFASPALAARLDLNLPAYLRRRAVPHPELREFRSRRPAHGPEVAHEQVSNETPLVVSRRLEAFYHACDRHNWHFTFTAGGPGYAEDCRVYDGLVAEARESQEKQEVFDAFSAHAFSGSAWSRPRRPKPVLAKASVAEVL